MKRIACLLLCLLALVSCRTTATEPAIDINTLIDPIKATRPLEVELIEIPASLSDIMTNSVRFQVAYEDWKAYAVALEGFYDDLSEIMGETK